ncbi:MAG: ATP-binding protein [Candidatus Sumerlaeota bacterium]|nr:ATP-binding protein [Candidatus Sumerlaeota bacterium]
MRPKRNLALYALLAAGWLAVSIWQIAEHRRVGDAAGQSLLARARDIATSLSVVIRSQGRFGVVPRPRLQAALDELANTSEVRAVGLLDLYGNAVVSAGEHAAFELPELADGNPIWTRDTLMVANVVELGPRIDTEPTSESLRLGRPDFDRDGRGGRPFRPGEERSPDFRDNPGTDTRFLETAASSPPSYEREPPRGPRPPGEGPPPDRDGRGRRFPRGRPPWISEEEFSQLMRLEGPYYLALLLSRGSTQALVDRDLWLRLALIAIGLVAAAGLGAAWRGATRSLDLEVRLARVQEMNTVLREMNLAAAGLAHETRNPLNIVRGLAQIISKASPESSDTRVKAQSIVHEVDRVASRLNEFIDYSKPRETRIAPTNLRALIAEVGEALETDREDKQIRFSTEGPDLSVYTDEPLLRQAVFNLLLNAVQSVGVGGRVVAAVVAQSPREAWLEVRDDGPGVPPEAREQIFRPYFTTRENGAGLGLSVVRQIVLAHRWEIEYLVSDEGLPTFRIKGLRVV